ncbi:T9SS type A sorting domain-containing protein [Winogradskyella sp.]|nr:T9SS type A sorting domain-containing protein [Winogradskyella sp.]
MKKIHLVVLLLMSYVSIAQDLTVISGGSITIHKDNYVFVGGDFTNTAGTVTLNSASDQYSSLIINGTATGDVNYKRYINAYTDNGISDDNDLVSAPVSGQTFGAFSSNSDNANLLASETLRAFAPFDKSVGAYVNYNTSTNANTVIAAGTGYRAATSDGGTLTFTGSVETSTIAINIQDSGPFYADWNLIGNPYPSYVNLAAFLNHEVSSGVTNLDILESASGIYGYDGDVSDGWDIITLANVGSRLLAPGQGFFVAADAADVSTYDLEFTPAMRTTSSDDDFIAGRSSDNDLTFFNLNLSTSNKSYNTEFYFNANATSGLDAGYDAVVWGADTSGFVIYSHLVENNTGAPIALQALGNDDLSAISIPLGVNANAGEQLTFSITEFNLPSSSTVYLEDSFKNTTTLLNSSAYVLTPVVNLSGTGRFYLRFTNHALSTTENTLSSLNIFNESANKRVVINGVLQQSTTARIYDLQGREVGSQDLDSNKTSQYMDVGYLSTGVYVVSLTNDQQSISKKIIIH